MNYLAPVTLIVATAGLAGFALQDSADSDPSTSLPGARPTIDASQFATLQSALDALPKEGGLVLLPAGEFEIDQPLVIRSEDVCLTGAGTATHIKNVNTDGKPALVLAHQDFKTDRSQRLWRIRLANFRLTGNLQSGNGIEAYGINEIFIDGVTVSYHGGDGILLDHCYEDPRICNCLITYNKRTGLNLLGCHDIVVAANQFEENQDALHCIDGFNLCMTGNCLDDHLGAGVVIENTYGSVVSGNMIEECRGAAAIMDRDCYGNTISANVIAHNGAGIDLRDAHGCAISANTFTIMKTDALRIGAGSGRIAVGGNAFSSSYIGDGKDKRRPDDQTAAGVVLDGTSDVNLSGNIFSGVGPKAVSLGEAASKRVVFTGNALVDTESEHSNLKQSIVDGNLSDASK